MAEWVSPGVDVTILSQEDLPDESTLATFRRYARLLVVTEGAQGCRVYMAEEAYHIPVAPVRDVEPTEPGMCSRPRSSFTTIKPEIPWPRLTLLTSWPRKRLHNLI